MDVFLYKVGQGFPTAAAKKNQNAGVSSQPAKPDTAAGAGPSLRFADLRESLAAAPAINEEKVAKIGDAIRSGRYEADARNAASKLLDMEFRLP